MAGNLLGQRRKIRYISDTGVAYRITTDADLVDAKTGTDTGNLAETQTAPKGFKPRGVYVQAFIEGTAGEGASQGTPGRIARKFLICNAGAALLSDSPGTILIDGVLFVSTGRRGESQRFI